MANGAGRVHYLKDEDRTPKISKEILKRILSYFKPYRWQVMLAIVAIFIISILELVPSLLLKNIVDIALPNQDLILLGILVILSIASTSLLNLIQVGQLYINTWISKHIIFTMKNDMYEHLSKMSLAFFSGVKPGEITTRMNSDVDGIQDIFNSTMVNALNSFFIFTVTAVTLFIMDWQLALIGIATIPLFIIPTRKVGKVRWKIADQSQQKVSEQNEIIQETLGISGSILMKIFTTEKMEAKKFEDVNSEVIALQLKEMLAGRWFKMTINIFTTIGPMLVYFFGGIALKQGSMSIGGILMFAALLTKLYGPITQMSNIHIDITRSFALFGRIFDYLDKELDIKEKPNAEVLSIDKGQIDFQQISFSYNETKEVLHDVNFIAYANQMTALVGPSGSGKTTITNLIPRLYDATKGSIMIDNQNICDVTLESLRSQIGLVMQEPYLFNATIRENLFYGNPDVSVEEMEEACRTAYIHDFIAELPEGYDTIVGNRGIKLSGGEKQRISIARVLLKDPRLIVMDEATSALDSMSEEYIQKAMVPLLQGRTSIVIAHRLSTILNADQIIVIDDGKIAQKGHHEELLAQGGLYKELYETQFKTQE